MTRWSAMAVGHACESRAVLPAEADHASSGIAWMMTRTGNYVRKRSQCDAKEGG